MSKSIFENVSLAPPDKILGLAADFRADPHPNKVSLIVGAYRTEEGAPYVLPVVRKVENAIAADKALNHEYLPIGGMPELCRAAVKLALGKFKKSKYCIKKLKFMFFKMIFRFVTTYIVVVYKLQLYYITYVVVTL